MFTIMFPVMSDYAKLTESEIQELNDHCDTLREEAIAAQERGMSEDDLLECEGCGEQWFRHSFPHVKGNTIDWCRKCYKNDPYFG